ncbi:M20/M25/M40 family metallo-hydrolase [Thermococcus peptonophilus]|uniref:M20/M25/M40 family metallo-hydrolase n=1 Tax=Thermococcus peptonophilus TaxID=53952 RepID=UPI000AA9158B
MKGGLVALLAAFLEISKLPPKKERPSVIFTAVSDEEGFSRGGTWELIKSGKLDKADLVLVGEPTNEKLMLGARGGRFVIEVKAKGKKAHAARPYLASTPWKSSPSSSPTSTGYG